MCRDSLHDLSHRSASELIGNSPTITHDDFPVFLRVAWLLRIKQPKSQSAVGRLALYGHKPTRILRVLDQYNYNRRTVFQERCSDTKWGVSLQLSKRRSVVTSCFVGLNGTGNSGMSIKAGWQASPFL